MSSLDLISPPDWSVSEENILCLHLGVSTSILISETQNFSREPHAGYGISFLWLSGMCFQDLAALETMVLVFSVFLVSVQGGGSKPNGSGPG